MASPLHILEQVAGAALMLVVLLDVLLTVLYARIGTGIISTRLARSMWYVFRGVGRTTQAHRGKVLSFCGPIILVALVLVWALGLTLGTALVLHPHLGTAVTASSGHTDTDFVTAMFAGGSSISIVGAGNYKPQTDWCKMFYLLNSLIGMSVLSLTLTYLMQIYNALKTRNSVGLQFDIATGKTGDAAELVRRLGAQGHFDSGYSSLANLAQEITDIKEAHHFYPVLYYFRFEEPFYSVSRLTNTALDAVTLIRTALDSAQYRWFMESGAVANMHDASLLLLVTLQDAFVSGGAPEPESPDPQTREQWRRRFYDAVSKLRAANIAVAPNLVAAADSYVALRSEWSVHVSNLAPSMLYSMVEVDPASQQPTSSPARIRRVA